MFTRFKTWTRVLLVTTLAILGLCGSAVACHHETARLRQQFSAQKDALVCAYRTERKAMAEFHRLDLEQLRRDRKGAMRLCGAERKVAVKQIDCLRRDMNQAYARDLRDLQRTHRDLLARLQSEYRRSRKMTASCDCFRCDSFH